jgi:hypothetical protein
MNDSSMARRLSSMVMLLLSLTCVSLAALWVVTRWEGTIAVPLSARPGRAHFVVIGGSTVFIVTQQVVQPRDGSWTADVGEYGRFTVRSGGASAAQVSIRGFLPPRGLLGFCSFRVRGPTVTFTQITGGVATGAMTYSGVGVPLWFLLGLAGAFPAVAGFRHRRHRRLSERSRRGLCLTCGYDLRASPDRCPECGSTSRTPK